MICARVSLVVRSSLVKSLNLVDIDLEKTQKGVFIAFTVVSVAAPVVHDDFGAYSSGNA